VYWSFVFLLNSVQSVHVFIVLSALRACRVCGLVHLMYIVYKVYLAYLCLMCVVHLRYSVYSFLVYLEHLVYILCIWLCMLCICCGYRTFLVSSQGSHDRGLNSLLTIFGPLEDVSTRSTIYRQLCNNGSDNACFTCALEDHCIQYYIEMVLAFRKGILHPSSKLKASFIFSGPRPLNPTFLTRVPSKLVGDVFKSI